MSDTSSNDTDRGPDFWDNHCSRCSDELAEGRDATLCKECSREIEMKRRERGDRCERCDGHGYIYGTICDLERAMNGRDTRCPVCHGSGRVPYEPEDDGRLVPDGGQVEAVPGRADGYTPPYRGSRDDYNVLEMQKHGYDVPDCVREGGATRPQEREESENGGVFIRSMSFSFECEECSDVRRFSTSDFMTQYWCKKCGAVRWFRFDWELNKRSVETETDCSE
jgi:hypothetical protein